MEIYDMLGKDFGNWHVDEKADSKGNWNCSCNICGAKRKINGYHLRNGTYPKCTCIKAPRIVPNKEYGWWTPIKYEGNEMWTCRCRCGTIKQVRADGLASGRSQSCGCKPVERPGRRKPNTDLTGQTIGYWKVNEYIGGGLWDCTCKCGTQRKISTTDLVQGKTTSCGCKKWEKHKQTMLDRYGVENYSNIRNNLTQEQAELLHNKDKLYSLIKSLDGVITAQRISNITGIKRGTVCEALDRFHLWGFVSIDKNSSSYEDEIAALLGSCERNNRSILDGKELDLWFPKQRIGIEFCGNYWHSEYYKDSKYHQEKFKLACNKNIKLITIFEYEWKDDELREKIINYLKRVMYPQDNVEIGERDCSVSIIDKTESREFQSKYHLMGAGVSNIDIGLRKDGELIGVMTFSKPRFAKDIEWEMVRIAWKAGVIVNGGSEKMFKYFLDTVNPSSIITYADLSKFSGAVYKRLGFKFVSLTDPEYVWYNTSSKQILSRYKTQKKDLVASDIESEHESEAEIMHKNGWIRIYDCGNAKFIWRK